MSDTGTTSTTLNKSVFLELTKHCNLNCVHCYVVDNTHRNELTTDEVKRILDELAAERFLFLALTGGEVLLRPDFFEITAHAQRRQFAITVFTNGTLITGDIADRLATLRCYAVEISLHGATPATCDAVTAVAGSYEQILRGIRLLKARGVRVALKANVLDMNIEEIRQIGHLAMALGVGFRGIDAEILPRFSGDVASTHLAASDRQLLEFYANMFRASSGAARQGVLAHPCPSAGALPCGIGSDGQVTIGADGYLYPCPLWRFHGFNLRKMSFHDAYHRKAALIPEVINARWHDLEHCSDCDATGNYHHCFAAAMRTTGDPLAHIPLHHRIAQAKTRALAQVEQERQDAAGLAGRPAAGAA